eukprot:m.126336 g.126336  ORF g.126336 m.126336 type:complete len:215 (+) comp22183_c0_seq6:57-701(+)
MEGVIRWDERTSYALYLGQSSVSSVALPLCYLLDSHSAHCRLSAHEFIWLPVIAVALRLDESRAYFWINLCLGFLVDCALAVTVKGFVRRERPVYQIGTCHTISLDRFSFPSGHATRVTFLACFFGRIQPYLALPYLNDATWVAVITCWCATVAISRVVYGRHHVLDVLGGMLIGIVSYIVTAKCLWVTPDQATAWHQIIATPVFPYLHALVWT